MKIMAVDLGKARTGIAISDIGERLASPVGTITEYVDERLLPKIADAAKEKRAEMIVVGHPGRQRPPRRGSGRQAGGDDRPACHIVGRADDHRLRHRLSQSDRRAGQEA